MIKIALLDNSKLFRASIQIFIDKLANCRVELSTNSLSKTCDYKGELDIIIVDPSSFKDRGEFWLDRLQLNFSETKIIVLTSGIDSDLIAQVVHKKVYAFFSKEDSPNELSDVIRSVSFNHKKKTYFSESIKDYILENSNKKENKNTDLSDRELQILELICEEKTNTEISKLLQLSVRTVESHRRRMIDKMQCKSIVGVIINAVRSNVLNNDKFRNTFLKNGLERI